eukprot:COSAG02_NODE_53278_length_302_cov_110.448276_1_plen_41_part_01
MYSMCMYQVVLVLVGRLPVVAADCSGKDCEIDWTGLGRSVH